MAIVLYVYLSHTSINKEKEIKATRAYLSIANLYSYIGYIPL